MEFVQTSYTVQEILDEAVNVCAVLNGETEKMFVTLVTCKMFVTLMTTNGSAQGNQ